MSKHALCIGNNYPGTSAALRGCVNDAHDWAALLESEGYQVTVVEEATKAQALDYLTTMVDQAGFGDRLVFTYSGHGSWLPDEDGDEADGRDECLVMADYRDGGLLLDDEIQEIFGELPLGAGALIISDSCHSGTVSRLVDLTGPAVATTHPRFLSPVEFTDLSEERVLAAEQAPPSKPRRTASLISGSNDTQFSYDAFINGRFNGALTRAALDAYRPGISLAAWHEGIRRVLPSDEYPQDPQMTAASTYRRTARAL